MRYVQLRAFHYVAVCGGFSRAAEMLFLTQPAISDQVRKLEEEYDVLLFNRHKKQVTPTASGLQLLEITRRMFDTEQQALELLSESRALRSGTLRIVADAAHHLLHILGQFRQKYPGIQVSVRAGNTETVISSLYSYEADIGVLGEIPTGRDFEIVKLNSTPIIAFVSTDHPLATAKSLSLHELSLLPLVMRERGSKTRAKLEDLASKEGYEFKPAIEAEGREAVREIVASGAGVGFVSAAEFGQDVRLVQIPIAAPEMLMDEALICLKERSGGKLVRVFLDIARSMATG
ncbi:MULTISPECIES: LysR substrate-binding domain-containing protein [Aminobacter]|jgi:aminoethylphosphonate catabolism LysR family transcriptional regulator|uniref:Aminoethylphosphonate catabolism LysR family transcriptional regulator n=1 Tax=Aminobacter ciceronei TaxID=150723 RepID=A0ABR6CA78_9HYPH|nr:MULTISPECIES: LysR substrate-binding domain-containing protein [Aminobacter]MBA8908094.1 aminoethylphosphonate catabolism LysR family transcriptional regulator [Aminobacter ciceronei]MBA9021922.1 aminoethylphosphonate catabolism LysR family transcriptional regulator [Aminobacter ciceronei]QOF74558.1 LysR family transcriptional regulator [Aminobacter sp. SR38]BBD40878.1 LysR family transcriptional regulator [Aminobacter sp. SS-2016]